MAITEQLVEAIENSEDWQERYQRQVQLEEKMRTDGVDRFWMIHEKNRTFQQESGTRSVKRLLNAHLLPMVEAIDAFMAEARSGKAGKKHTAVRFMEKLDAEALALLTVRTVLDGLSSQKKLVAVAREIALLIQDEISYRTFAEVDQVNHSHLVKRIKGDTKHKQRSIMKHNMKGRQIEIEHWSVGDELKVGSKLIDLLIQSSGTIRLGTVQYGEKKREKVLLPTAEVMEWLKQEDARCSLMSPTFLPCVIPPKPWTTPYDGGYWTARVRRLKLMKGFSVTKEYLEELAEHDIDPIYDALNAMQSTPWAINGRVLNVARELWQSGSTLSGIPEADDRPAPTKPSFLDQDDYPKELWTDAEMKEFKEWKRDASDMHSMNLKNKSLRLQFVKVLHTAELFEQESEIFFPHQMDFRGRVYAVPLFLNPQGSDFSKGLLTFADKVAIKDEEDADWLRIHGANVYGEDKCSLAERVQWVKGNEMTILAVAEDPFNHRFWCDADKPWQFLAFCFDYAAFMFQGFGYESSLPVQMDGSCNGLQHFSAMLRDEIGGQAVNLLPGEKPSDVYGIVAEKVLERVRQDALSDDQEIAGYAKGWLQHGITRKVAKRPVMTLSYGATEFGFKQQIFDDTVKPYKAKVKREDFPWDGSGWKASAYMGALIWECTGKVVIAARGAMEWLQGAARSASKEELPVRWETPDGLPVVQSYPQMDTKRFNLTFGGRRVVLSAGKPKSSHLNKSKQASGIAPNWVHSMDASHMRLTVLACWQHGLRSFSLVHDSYGTHAGNAWIMAESLREEFIKIYDVDVLDKFKREIEWQLPEGKELPAVPAKGNLELTQVRESEYFFA
ncbi:DNA-directed RNA polymerase [Endozoicomonas ascidiicola]|uniref:DNA-directed RNA polymerase n=1 Tax=Endozoicomonas ascidiicola TaxID=1698521 RepID=UPI00082D3025|nr:DNA-directed RNA polymerase [Endozoicomonas ascidiicola]